MSLGIQSVLMDNYVSRNWQRQLITAYRLCVELAVKPNLERRWMPPFQPQIIVDVRGPGIIYETNRIYQYELKTCSIIGSAV